MSEPIVMHALDRTEISWSDEPGNKGLLITQTDALAVAETSIWIPEGHVSAFVSAVQKVNSKR